MIAQILGGRIHERLLQVLVHIESRNGTARRPTDRHQRGVEDKPTTSHRARDIRELLLQFLIGRIRTDSELGREGDFRFLHAADALQHIAFLLGLAAF